MYTDKESENEGQDLTLFTPEEKRNGIRNIVLRQRQGDSRSKRKSQKCQILISLKNFDDFVKTLTVLKVFGLICHHSILLTNQNIIRFFFCILS